MRLRGNGDNQSCLWHKKTFLANLLSGNHFSDLNDWKSGRKAADFFLSDRCAIPLIPLSPPPDKTVLFTVFFPHSLFTMQIIYSLGLIYIMKGSVSLVVLVSNKPKASSANSTRQHCLRGSPLCLPKKNMPHARCLFHPCHSGSS